MGCSLNCCCRNATTSQLSNYLFFFVSLIFLISLIAVFVRVGRTERYKEALQLLEEKNNNIFNSKFPLSCFKASSKNGGKNSSLILRNLYGDRCELEGKILLPQDEKISLQTHFKNWKKTELALNLLRTIIIGLYLFYIIFIKCKYLNNINNTIDDLQAHTNLSNHFIISTSLSMILTYTSALFMLIRMFVFGTNTEIGLYEKNSTDFEDYMVYNYIADIADIVLAGICICFSIRIKQAYNLYREQRIPHINQNPPFPNNNYPNIANNRNNLQAPEIYEISPIQNPRILPSIIVPVIQNSQNRNANY